MRSRSQKSALDEGFSDRVPAYVDRVDRVLDAILPAAATPPARLHEAMRYAVLNGGKRMRPLLVYATGEVLGVTPDRLDAPAAAIELIHAFSLVHDDLPAMDDDDLRRGQPTVHCKYDEATAILAADALQPLAFELIAAHHALTDREAAALVRVIAAACGSLGMTGGQAIDLAAAGRKLSVEDLTRMHKLKTGALIHACVASAATLYPELEAASRLALDRFAHDIGLAFQIRDDLLDEEGKTHVIGKPAGSDRSKGKATWPSVFGVEASKQHCNELLDAAMRELEVFGASAEPLRTLANYIVARPK